MHVGVLVVRSDHGRLHLSSGECLNKSLSAQTEEQGKGGRDERDRGHNSQEPVDLSATPLTIPLRYQPRWSDGGGTQTDGLRRGRTPETTSSSAAAPSTSPAREW